MVFKYGMIIALFLTSVGCGKWYGEEPWPVKSPELNSTQTTQSAS